MPGNFLKSRLFVLAGLAILATTLFFLGKELRKTYQIRREIQKLQAGIATYQSKNEEILKLINYFKTPEYRERQARQLLNLQKPGEFAVALPPSSEETETPPGDAPKPPESNLYLWWNYFFGHE